MNVDRNKSWKYVYYYQLHSGEIHLQSGISKMEDDVSVYICDKYIIAHFKNNNYYIYSDSSVILTNEIIDILKVLEIQ